MKREFSAGVVVFTGERAKERTYLLLHYESGHWDFAKGHIEKCESKEQAALRELQEEAGIGADLLTGFEESFQYFNRDKAGQLYLKKVYFFIGRAHGTKITLSHEHTGFLWLAYEEALRQLTYENARQLLHKVEAFLNSQ